MLLLLPPPPQAAARNARATARVAAVTSHFHRILRFKTYLPVWMFLSRARAAPPPARRVILSEIEPRKLVRTVMEPRSEPENGMPAKAQLLRLRLVDDAVDAVAPRRVEDASAAEPERDVVARAPRRRSDRRAAARRPGCRPPPAGRRRAGRAARPRGSSCGRGLSSRCPARSCRPRDRAPRGGGGRPRAARRRAGRARQESGSPPSAAAGSQPG